MEGRGVNYIHNCHGSWISQYQTRATVEIFFTRLRLVKNISTVALVWYCEIHSHDSCVYTITPLYVTKYTIHIMEFCNTPLLNTGNNLLFPPARGASWGILNRYWLDTNKSPECFDNLYRLNEVAR